MSQGRNLTKSNLQPRDISYPKDQGYKLTPYSKVTRSFTSSPKNQSDSMFSACAGNCHHLQNLSPVPVSAKLIPIPNLPNAFPATYFQPLYTRSASKSHSLGIRVPLSKTLNPEMRTNRSMLGLNTSNYDIHWLSEACID